LDAKKRPNVQGINYSKPSTKKQKIHHIDAKQGVKRLYEQLQNRVIHAQEDPIQSNSYVSFKPSTTTTTTTSSTTKSGTASGKDLKNCIGKSHHGMMIPPFPSSTATFQQPQYHNVLYGITSPGTVGGSRSTLTARLFPSHGVKTLLAIPSGELFLMPHSASPTIGGTAAAAAVGGGSTETIQVKQTS